VDLEDAYSIFDPRGLYKVQILTQKGNDPEISAIGYASRSITGVRKQHFSHFFRRYRGADRVWVGGDTLTCWMSPRDAPELAEAARVERHL
jgi:hypothetical protein